MRDEEVIEVKQMASKSDLGIKLSGILDEVEQNPGLRLLMKEICKPDSVLSEFLLTDSNLVFVAENLTEPAPNGATAIRLPVLFWTSVALDAQPTESLQRLSLFTEWKKEDIETSKLQLYKMFSQVLDVRDFRDLLAYFSLKFARSSPKTKDLVRRRKFSFREMQKTLGNYEDIDPNILFSEISDTSKSSLHAETDRDCRKSLFLPSKSPILGALLRLRNTIRTQIIFILHYFFGNLRYRSCSINGKCTQTDLQLND